VDPAWFEKVLYPLNDDDRFQVWADRLLEAWRAEAGWQLSVQRRDPRFVRASLSRDDVPLKIEFVNDVRGRVGTPVRHTGFGLVLRDALVGASSKAVGVFAADVARAILGTTEDDWRLVRWISPPPPAGEFLRDLRALGEDLLLIRE
jgi:hypothetical protein